VIVMVSVNADQILDAETWDVVAGILRAGSGDDLAAYRAALLRLKDLPDDNRAGVYLYYMLWSRADSLIRKPKPTLSDFAALAQRAYPKFSELVVADKITLEHTLRTVFDQSDFGTQLQDGAFTIYSSAALSALLDDPENDLKHLRSKLASWIQRKYAPTPDRN